MARRRCCAPSRKASRRRFSSSASPPSTRRDFATYRISVDNYLNTHAPENEELTTELYRRLAAGGFIGRKTIKQAYDEQRQMFLPDRYVRGTCPVCNTPDQYGDSCESCGATYSPLELKDAVSTVSGTPPTVRESEHLFLKLSAFEAELRDWVAEHVDAVLARKLDEWFKAGLKDWDISRDPPYFGFRIPGERDKFFYVWFDAPIGYMASFLNLCRREGIDFDEFWGARQPARALSLHRQGHPLLPRAVLARDALGRAVSQAERPVRARPCDRRRPKDLEAPRQLHHGRRLREAKSTPTICATTTPRSSARRPTISI